MSKNVSKRCRCCGSSQFMTIKQNGVSHSRTLVCFVCAETDSQIEKVLSLLQYETDEGKASEWLNSRRALSLGGKAS